MLIDLLLFFRIVKATSRDIPPDTVDLGITPPPFAYVTSVPDIPRVSLVNS